MTTEAAPDTTAEEKTWRCNATIDDRRCNFRGTNPELETHATDVGHPICDLCPRSLTSDETRVCGRCVGRVRDNLTAIRNAHQRLPDVSHHAGYRSQPIPGGNAMVILAGGSMVATGPDDPTAFGDPLLVADILTEWEFSWRDDRRESTALRPNITTTTTYLIRHLAWASGRSEFSGFARMVEVLASAVTHTAGVANDPVQAPAACFDCGGALISPYTAPTVRDHRTRLAKIAEQRKAEISYGITALTPVDLTVKGRSGEGRHLVDGDLPIWECRKCSRVYEPAAYWLALRAALEAQAEAAG